MGTFGMNTGEVHKLGVAVTDNAQDFGTNNKKIYDIVTSLVHSHFTSPEAIALEQKLESFKPMLNEMQAALNAQGEHGMTSARKTEQTSDELSSMVAKNFDF